MRTLLAAGLLAGALALGACGSPTSVNDAANQAATAVSDPTAGAAIDQAATIVADPTTGALVDQAATAVTAPEVATAVSDAASTLEAVANDVTLAQGEALVLDATQSAGEIQNYKWTIAAAPAGAESVVGQVIQENSNGNVSIDPADWEKYFPATGDYTIQLDVTDAAGQTSADQFVVTVP